MEKRIFVGIIVGLITAIGLRLYRYISNYKTNLKIRNDEKDLLAEQNKERLSTLSKENLKKLKDSNLLTQEEYDSKLSQITNKDIEESIKKTNDYVLLKNLYDSGLLNKIEFEEKTKILIEKQSIGKTSNQQDVSIKVSPQFPNNPTKENQFRKSTLPKKDNSWKIAIILSIVFFGGIIIIGSLGGFKKSESEEESSPNYEKTIMPQVKQESANDGKNNWDIVKWNDVRYKNFSFSIPENLILDENLSNENRQVYVDNTNNIGLSIDVGTVPEGSNENTTIKTLINDVKTFSLSVNTEQRKNFNDIELINYGYDKLGNAESIFVSQTSKNISGNKNIQMMVFSKYVVSYPYYFSFTFSFYEGLSGKNVATITQIMNSFKFESTRKTESIIPDSDIEVTNYTVNQNRAYFYSQPSFEFKRNAYLVFGEVISGSLKKNGFVYVDYVNSNGIKTTGWLSISDLE